MLWLPWRSAVITLTSRKNRHTLPPRPSARTTHPSLWRTWLDQHELWILESFRTLEYFHAKEFPANIHKINDYRNCWLHYSSPFKLDLIFVLRTHNSKMGTTVASTRHSLQGRQRGIGRKGFLGLSDFSLNRHFEWSVTRLPAKGKSIGWKGHTFRWSVIWAATNLALHSSIPSTWLWGLNGWNHKRWHQIFQLNEDFIILNEKTQCFESSYPLFHHARWQNSPSRFLPRCSTKVLHGGGVLKCFFVWWKCLPKISSEVDTTLNFRIQLVNLQMIQLTSFRITQVSLFFIEEFHPQKERKRFQLALWIWVTTLDKARANGTSDQISI